MSDHILAQVERLPCWTGPVEIEQLGGGITNVNFKVSQGDDHFVVRVGDDIPVHQVMRFNELAAARAAHRIGVSPEVVHWEPGMLVIRFVAGRVFTEADVRDPANLPRVLELVRRFHKEMPNHLRGPALMFWVFHVIRDYAHSLRDGDSPHEDELPRLLSIAEQLEVAVGRVNLVYGHNDLLPANLIDDGERLWLIDFDYAGFNSPLFDLSNLASNNSFDETQERWLLENYFAFPMNDGLWRAYQAMKCASLLRETMWSMVSEIHSVLDFDYAVYTAENLSRFEAALSTWRGM